MEVDERKEIDSLKNQIKTLRVLYLAVVIIFAYSIIHFQIQYANIRSYYQESLDNHHDLLIELEKESLRLEQTNLILEEYLSMIE